MVDRYKINYRFLSLFKSDDELCTYFRNNEFTANFLKIGNLVCQEKCRMNKVDDELQIRISDGNHSKDFDTIMIVDNSMRIICQLEYMYCQYRQGYGTFDINIKTKK